jgi:hypothetical protein
MVYQLKQPIKKVKIFDDMLVSSSADRYAVDFLALSARVGRSINFAFVPFVFLFLYSSSNTQNPYVRVIFIIFRTISNCSPLVEFAS